MSDAAAARTAKLKLLGSLDIDFHESTHSRNVRSMSTRKLVSNRHDDLLRSGSTHQLLNRPFSSSQTGGAAPPASLLAMPPGPSGPPPPPGAAESLATEETAQDTLSDSGSEFSGGSFCEAEGDSPADREYLRKDLGASLHDDELEFNSGDEAGGDGDDDDDDDDGLIADVKNRMKIEEEAAAKEAEP